MTDDRPQVIVQYVTKNEGAGPMGCLEMFISVILLFGFAMALGWFR